LSKKRSLLFALSGLLAAVFGTVWWRRGASTSTAETASLSKETALPDTPIVKQAAVVPQWVVIAARLTCAVLGVLCLTQAQHLLLISRMPMQPLLLSILGIALVLPLSANYSSSSNALLLVEMARVEAGKSRRILFVCAALFFVVVSVGSAQLGRASLLLWFTWLLGIVATLLAINMRFVWRTLLNPKLLTHAAPDVAIALGLPLILALLMRLTFAPETPLPQHSSALQALNDLANNHPFPLEGGYSPFYLTVQRMIAPPTPRLSDLQRLSGLFALALVPGIYAFGYALDGRWIGIFAAGFSSAGVWTLALAKAGTTDAAAALCSALYLTILFFEPSGGEESAERVDTHSDIETTRHALAGLALAVGWLISPSFLYMALLLPIRVLFGFLDQRPLWWHTALRQMARLYRAPAFLRWLVLVCTPVWFPLLAAYRWLRAQKRIPNLLIALLLVLIAAAPFVSLSPRFSWLPIPQISPNFEALTGIPLPYAFVDALAYGLLLFNLARDPSPVHGVINRPVFMTLLSALFLVGLLGWAWRIYRTRRWRAGMLLAALIIALLPMALDLSLPLTYPNVWRAALSLPIAICIAAYGAASIAQSLQMLFGRAGIGIALALLVLTLWLVAADAHQHYNEIALPAYESAAPLLSTP
jgi:hypothetical protein